MTAPGLLDTNSPAHNELATIGYAALVRSRAAPMTYCAGDPLTSLIVPAARQRTIKVYFNINGLPVAYVIWAKLGREAEQRLLRNMRVLPGEHEFHSGASLWVLDLVAPHGNLKYVLADLRDQVFASEHAVRYLRHKLGRLIAKEVARDCCTYFLSAPPAPQWRCASDACPFCAPLAPAPGG